MQRYANKYKIEAISRSHRTELNTLLELYGGKIELDARLWPGEYWYHTDAKKEVLKQSGLIKILDGTS